VAAQYVLEDRPLADIGTDHAYLPVYLVANGVIPRAIAADLMSGPLEAARTTVLVAGLEEKIALRLGSGLSVLVPGEAATVSICGMGGPLIAQILEDGPLGGVERLVLQPMGGEERLRRWLAQNGWRLVAEQLVEDSGRLYLVAVAEPGCMSLSDEEALVGQHLRDAGGPLLVRYAGSLLEQGRGALDGARRSERPEARERVTALEWRVRVLEEAIADADRNHR
jgi:tRNA (adenine22-N1)-methyltransferase